jgi:hypothetical protein
MKYQSIINLKWKEDIIEATVDKNLIKDISHAVLPVEVEINISKSNIFNKKIKQLSRN